MANDSLARGARSAQFAAGDNRGEIEIQNQSSEPREELAPIEIDRTRKVKQIIPKKDMIWVRRREADNVSAGGILIPTEAKDAPAEGTIISVGPKVEDLREGQHIIFGKYAGTEYPWGGETLLFMTESEVIAVVEE